MVEETQRELQNKYIKIFEKSAYVHGYIKKSNSLKKLNNKSINANRVYEPSQIGKFFIDNPNDCLALKVPEDVVITDLDYPEISFLNKDENYKIIKAKYEGVIDFLIAEKKKVIITQTSKGYHIYSKCMNEYNKYTNNASNSGNMSYSLLDQVDYKFGNDKGTTYVYAPLHTDHSMNESVKERRIVYIGIDSLDEMEEHPIVLQSPKAKVTLKDKVMAWRSYVEGGNLNRLNKDMREGSRETTLFEYANRLMDFGFNLSDMAECLVFINEYVLGEGLSDAEVANIFNQMHQQYKLVEGKDEEDDDSNLTMALYLIASEKNFGLQASVTLERRLIEYIDTIFEDTIIINQEVLIKEDNSYNYHNLSELKSIITKRIEDVTGPGYAVKQFVNMIYESILRRKVITRYEYEQLKTPDHIVVFKNGFYDLESEMFSSEPRHGEINLKVLSTRYNPEPKGEMKQAVKDYLMGLANNDINTYKNIRDMLGTILFKDTRLHKSFFILYGSKDGNNGKSTFFELLHTILGRSLFSTTSIEQMIAKFGLAPLDNTILTTCGEIGEEVTSGYEILKAVTGGDELPLEKKGLDQYMGKLTTTLIFASNHKTKFTNAQGDNALNKRAKFIDFHNEFSSNNIDHEFDIRLLKDQEFQEAFLYEMIECSTDLKLRNFNFHRYISQRPTEFINKIKANGTKADLVSSFVSTELHGNNGEGVKRSVLWEAFEDYANRTPHTTMPSQKEFFVELFNEHGIEMETFDTSFLKKRVRGKYTTMGNEIPTTFVNSLSEFRLRQSENMKKTVNNYNTVYSEDDLI